MNNVLANPEDVPKGWRRDAEEAASRALSSGARPPLTFIGAGMTSFSFCDSAGRAFKAANDGVSRRIVENEAEWFKAAEGVPGMAPHLPGKSTWHPDQGVLERDCVEGRPGAWADEGKLFNLHGEIEKAMLPHGWTAPEFKGDSYVLPPDGGPPVLVDAGFAQRVGTALLDYVVDILEGRREPKLHERSRDLAFYVCREMQEGTIPKGKGEEVLAMIEEAV